LDCPDGRHFRDILLPRGFPQIRQSQNTLILPNNYTIKPIKSQGKQSQFLNIFKGLCVQIY